MPDYSEGTRQFIDAGFITESQVHCHPVGKIIEEMRTAKAEGTLAVGCLDLDFHDMRVPLDKSIEMACEAIEIIADQPHGTLLVFTFPTPHRVMRVEEQLKRFNCMPLEGEGIKNNVTEGWILYGYMVKPPAK